MGLRGSLSLKDLAATSLASGIALIVGVRLTPSAEPTAGLRLPIAWAVMPFWGWMALGGCLYALFQAVRAMGAVRKEHAALAWRRSLLGLAVCAVGIFLTGRDGGVEILRGAIQFSAGSMVAVLLLALAAVMAIVLAERGSKSLGVLKSLSTHLALLAGSVVFGLPFVWLLITSFKEDRDMSTPEGLVWVPRVQQTVPYLNPKDPLYESEFRGTTVQGSAVERFSDGSVKLDILRPMSMRGLTFIAKPPLKEVPRDIPLVTGTLDGQPIRGKVIEEKNDGQREVEVISPAALQGRRFVAKSSDVEPVRNIGLKWQNYPEALEYLPPEAAKGLTYLKNTFIIVFFSVVGTLLSSSLVAYAFARMRFPGKGALFLVLLSTMMLPAAVTLLPTFLIFRWLGWIDTLLPLWVPAFFGSAFNIFLLRQFFLTIPMELEDAAKMDGCNYLRTFWQVMLPQVKPALAVVAIWTFVAAWNNFMGPLVYLNSPENLPISYAVQLFQSERSAEPGYLMAFATMAMFPVLLLFFFAQRYFIEGVTLSGLGGK